MDIASSERHNNTLTAISHIPLYESLSATASQQKRLLQIIDMQQQCLVAETLKGVIDESGDASLDYFSLKKNVVRGDLKGLAR